MLVTGAETAKEAIKEKDSFCSSPALKIKLSASVSVFHLTLFPSSEMKQTEPTMEELHVYQSTEELPKQFEWQIRTFLRILWSSANEDEINEPLTAAELHPVYFVLAKEDLLISYSRIIRRSFNQLGNTFKMYGLGDVFTFPASRNKGYGKRVVSSATNYIRADSDADVALLLTDPSLENFYQNSGWEHIPNLKLLTGEQANPQLRDDFAMMLFLTEKAQQNRINFQTQSIFLLGDEW